MKTFWLALNLLTAMAVAPASFAQDTVIKMRAESYSTSDWLDTGVWSDWTPRQPTDVMIVLKGDRLVIYGNDELVFDIYRIGEAEEDEDGDLVSTMWSIGPYGNKCLIRLVRRDSSDGEIQLYIRFPDQHYVFNIEIKD